MEVSPSFALLFLLFSALIMAAECKQKSKPPATKPDDDDDDDIEEATTETAKKSLGRGFGDDVDWVEWDNAVSVALDVDKPIFLLVHKTWCGACTALKNSFKSSTKRGEFVELSKQFVMVNTEDDEEPEDDEYAPDGRYIPRLYFLDKKGKRLAVDNKKNYANNAHYFPQVIDVIKGMKKALKLYEKHQAQQDADEPEKPPSKTSSTKKTEKKNTERSEKKSPDTIKVPKTLINEELNEDQLPIEGNQQESQQDDDSLGEIYVSDEELSMMESGGCPHAAAARAAAQATEKTAEKEKQEAKSSKNAKKESEDKKKSEKSAKKQKLEL